MHRQLIRLMILLFALTLTGILSAQDAAFPANDRLLVWLAPGSQPGQQNPRTPGEIALMAGDGTTETLLALSPGDVEHVLPCGNNGWSPDRTYFALYAGRDSGGLYLVNSQQRTIQTLEDDIVNMVCVGDDTLRFSPDSTTLAYLAYDPDYISASSAVATLTIKSVETLQNLATIENVAAFYTGNMRTVYTSYDFNNRDEATELIINQWQPGGQEEIVSVDADLNCFFNSSSILDTGDELIVIAGHLCQVGNRRSNWRIYRISPENETIIQAATDEAAGGYRPTARSNQMWLSPDGARIYFTIPDGIANNTVSISMFDLNSEEVLPAMERFAIMHSTATRPYLLLNHSPVLSPNGQFLATTRNDANGDATLSILDFAAPDLPPIEISAGDRGDIIGEMLFTPDASQLIFSSGSDRDRDSNAMSLYNLNPISGGDFRLTRGRYGQAVMSPDGTEIVMLDRSHLDEDRPYSDLLRINLDTGEETRLFEGAQFEEGRATNRRFAYPLAWLR